MKTSRLPDQFCPRNVHEFCPKVTISERISPRFCSAIMVLNAIFGWWCSVPVAALIMVPIGGKEGFEALRGEKCDDRY